MTNCTEIVLKTMFRGRAAYYSTIKFVPCNYNLAQHWILQLP